MTTLRGSHRLFLALWGVWVLGWGARIILLGSVDLIREFVTLGGAEGLTSSVFFGVLGLLFLELFLGWPISEQGWVFMWLWGWPALAYAALRLTMRLGPWVRDGFTQGDKA